MQLGWCDCLSFSLSCPCRYNVVLGLRELKAREYSKSPKRSLLLIAAVSSGLLYGLAYPPFAYSWCVWFAVVPLLWAITRSDGTREAVLCGGIAGSTAYLLFLRPLVTASTWSGWEQVTTTELELMYTRQWWLLQFLWAGLATVGGGGSCALFAGSLRWLAERRLSRLMMLAPSLWIVIVEWLRVKLTWDFQWSLLGSATVDLAPVRQLAALGGVRLVSALVVVVNVGILSLVLVRRNSRPWRLPIVTAVIVSTVCLGGLLRTRSFSPEDAELSAAAIQHHRTEYTSGDYTASGFDANYLKLIHQIVARGEIEDLDLLVLPESINYGFLSLDGTLVPDVPREAQFMPVDWTAEVARSVGGGRTLVVMGVDTVDAGRVYNSLLFWSHSGAIGCYHKRRLVPFAEYQPRVMDWLGVEGRTQFSHGKGTHVFQSDHLALGGFICQEVLFSSIFIASVRDGANVLVSGGNDGVFSSPAVAEVHADLARMRAVETGRYVVRAMKTGISAIVDPTGRELARSPSSAPSVIRGRIQPLDSWTPYVRFGDWPLYVATLVIIVAVLSRMKWMPFSRFSAWPKGDRG